MNKWAFVIYDDATEKSNFFKLDAFPKSVNTPPLGHTFVMDLDTIAKVKEIHGNPPICIRKKYGVDSYVNINILIVLTIEKLNIELI